MNFVKKKSNYCVVNLMEKSMYSTFEEAFPYYINNGHLEESSEENREFNDMMEFLYLGRKANNTDKLEDPFVIIKMIGV